MTSAVSAVERVFVQGCPRIGSGLRKGCELIRPVSSERALFFLYSCRQFLCYSTFRNSPTLLRDVYTASISASHVDRRGVSSVLFCKFLVPLLGLTAFASTSPLSIARQTQVWDQCTGLGGNIITDFPPPVQSASGDSARPTDSPLALSILGASARYSWKMLAVSLSDDSVSDRC